MKKLLKNYENWFLKFKRGKKYWPKSCDVEFELSIDLMKKFIKKLEKDIYLKIDIEISSKKQDRATLTKAKRLAKTNSLDSKYIELRFNEIWEDITENKVKPQLATYIQSITDRQFKFEKKNKTSGFKMFSGYDSEKTS